jgi:predicted nucleotidyltransferase
MKIVEEDLIAKAKNIERGFQRTIYVMSVLTPRLEERGVKAVVVGGAAVEFYTRDWYATGDIDLAVNKGKRKELGKVLEVMGLKKMGRMWVREDLGLYIEAPGDIADIDIDKVTRIETDAGFAYVIGLEDIIFDRIQAAEHWNSESDKEQAIRMAAMFYDEIDWKYLRKKCDEEGSEKMLKKVKEAAKNAKERT